MTKGYIMNNRLIISISKFTLDVTEESRQEKWLELCTYYQLGSNVLKRWEVFIWMDSGNFNENNLINEDKSTFQLSAK